MDKIELKAGVTTSIRINRPAVLKIKTLGGTYLEINVTPNNPVDITPGNDVVSCDLVIEDQPFGPTEITR
ncbi:MAG: hypothetical protein ACK4ML_03810 [Alishewanella aestuarii]